MPKALAATAPLPTIIVPGMGSALAFMGGLAVVGGIAGAALIVSQVQAGRIPVSRTWLYGGIVTGVAIGGTIGYFAGRLIVGKTIAKLDRDADLRSLLRDSAVKEQA